MIFVIFGGFLLVAVDDSNFIREVVGFVKPFDFYLIPVLQIHSSAPIRSYIASKKI